ncbi:hypothetical protein Lal_00033500 [Lupinus albus]|nr:hypothetical protein Lal_00033500 [Lupinus albus]
MDKGEHCWYSQWLPWAIKWCREGNSCADNKLASYGIASKRNSTWKFLPSFLSIEYNRNRFVPRPDFRLEDWSCDLVRGEFDSTSSN